MVNPIIQGISILVGTLIIGVGIISTMLVMLRAHKFIVRDPLDKDAYIKQYLMMETKDKASGVLQWKSVWWQPKIVIPEPPKKAIDITKRGKKLVEAYRLSEDEYLWIHDKGVQINEIIDKKTGQKKTYISDLQKDGKTLLVDTFKPLTTVQREVIHNQYRKAQEIRAKRWTPDKIAAIAQFGIIAILLIMILIFWSDLVEPVRASQDRAYEMEKYISDIAERLAARGCNIDITKPQTPPTQDTNVIVTPGEKLPFG